MIIIDFIIAGTPLPIFAFDVSGGAHGSTGSCSVNTTIKMLSQVGFDLAGQSLSASKPLPVTLSTTDDNTGDSQVIFSGSYQVGRWDYNQDVVVIQCRDKAGDMVDQKRVNTSGKEANQDIGESGSSGGITTQNNKVSGFVKNITALYGIEAITNVLDDFDVGALFGDTSTVGQFSSPQTLWGFLTRLARDSGNIVYATPQNNIYFGAEGQGEALALTWRIPSPPGGGSYPILTLDITHNPARNASHKVTVSSYDHTSGKTTSGTKTKKQGTAKYTFHTDGLTQDQAQKRANATSKDISKREINVAATIDYLPTVKVGQPVTLSGEVDPTFLGYPLFVNQYTHGFRMGKGDGKGELFTTLTLLQKVDS